LSRRDRVIVARHEVPGTAPPQKNRPVAYGMIRAGAPIRHTTIGVEEISYTRIENLLYDFGPLGLAALDHTVPYGTVLSRDAFPGTSCQATISLSAIVRRLSNVGEPPIYLRLHFSFARLTPELRLARRDKSHSLIEGPRIKLAIMGDESLGWAEPCSPAGSKARTPHLSGFLGD
jgi:hypothetical protein